MDICMQNRVGKDGAEADWEGMREREAANAQLCILRKRG